MKNNPFGAGTESPVSPQIDFETIFLAGACVSGSMTGVNALVSGIYSTESRATGVCWSMGVGRLGAVRGSAAGARLFSRWLNGTLYRNASSQAFPPHERRTFWISDADLAERQLTQGVQKDALNSAKS